MDGEGREVSGNRAVKLSGALLLVGFAVNAIQRMLLHPGLESGLQDALALAFQLVVLVFVVGLLLAGRGGTQPGPAAST